MADTPDWAFSDYEKAADVAFAEVLKAGSHSAVVAFGKNGATPVVQKFDDSDAASSAYDVVVNAPTDRWYVALYDSAKSATPNGRVDETYFGGVNVTETKVETKTVKRPVAAIVATALALGVAIFAGRKRR